MRDLSRAFAVASLACLVAACSFTSSGSGGPGSEPVASNSIPTGGHASTPGQVDCNGANASGTANCSPSNPQASACCAGGVTPGTCMASTSTTCTGSQTLFQCDEAADCGAGQVCCLSGNVFSCQTSCTPSAQSCRLSSECAQGSACTVQDCQGTFTELCGPGIGCSSQ